MKILITGVAGFIGSRLAKNLLDSNYDIYGIDNLNNYYDVKLKLYRLNNLKSFKNFKFFKIDISDTIKLKSFFKKKKIDIICHLAAQAGVRYSLINPRVYAQSNINGFLEILEYCRFNTKTKLVYASSSSVYGGNKKIPFSVTDDVSLPVSLYAATKRANELMAESYCKLFSLKIIGLRFFTVYGPWGRPDMAIWKFTDAISQNKPINLFNKGVLKRDFTYIDDIIEGIRASLFYKNNSKTAYHKIYNLGNNKPISVNKIVKLLEKLLKKKAKKKFMPMQLGDVKNTFADISQSNKHLNYSPTTKIEKGLENFVIWFEKYSK